MSNSIEFQGHTVQELVDGESRVLIAPDHGARLLRWTIDDEQIIYWPEVADWSNIAGSKAGNPILFPFVARHMVDSVIGKWQDQNGVVRDLPMHGFARDMAFDVIDDGDPQTLRMRLRDSRQTFAMYPFHFQFDVVYRLSGAQLEVRLETTNTGNTALPYYAGHHFYFHVPHGERAEWSLSIPCRQHGGQNTDGSVWFTPTERTDFTLAESEIIDGFHVDLTSTDLLLAHGDRRITIDLGHTDGPNEVPWYSITTWTQTPESDFYCVEPWLGLPNAIHHGYGLRWLEPGLREDAVCVLRVE